DLIFSPDGKLLAAAGYEYKVWLWDLEKGNVARTFPGISAAFSPDGKHLAVAEVGAGARLYETATGKEMRQFKGHRSGIKHLLFTPDGQGLVTASFGRGEGSLGGRVEEWDRQVYWLWDVATGKVRRQFGGESHLWGPTLSPDGRTLSASGLLWELASGKARAALKGHGDMIFATDFTPDGKFLASASGDGTIRLWRLPAARHAHTFPRHPGSRL